MSLIAFIVGVSMLPIMVGLGLGWNRKQLKRKTLQMAMETPPLQMSLVPQGANPNYEKDRSVGNHPNGLAYLVNNGAQARAYFIKGYILIPVKIGTGPFKYWLLDSSISMNMIDWKYAHEIGLAGTGDVAVSDSVQRETYDIVRMTQLGVPNLEPNRGLLVFPRMDAIAADLSRGFRQLREELNPSQLHDRSLDSVPLVDEDLGGVLGFEFLSCFTTIIDYPRKRLYFTSLPLPRDMPSQGYVTAHRQFALPMQLQGMKGVGPWIVRTGTNFSLLSQPQPDGTMPERQTLYRVWYLGRQINTLYAQKDALIHTLTGPKQLHHQVFLTPFKSTNEAATWNEAGQLGSNVLEHFIVIFDAKSGKLVLAP